MNWHGLRWPVVALAFAGSLLAIWAGHRLLNRYDYQVPLEQAVARDKSVESFTVGDQGQPNIYQVRFPTGGNLEEEWRGLNRILADRTGGRPYRIEILDNPDQKLNQVYYNVQYAIYGALARGTFQAMAGRVENQAKQAGVTAGLWVDGRNIYLDLSDGGHSLQKVFPRTAATGTGGAVNG
ncbi:MAG: hypothetical protein M0Z41_16990 [Peptococcaceae bacterium]|nr:hypothetical protein [Peptococcaceae bacterium]